MDLALEGTSKSYDGQTLLEAQSKRKSKSRTLVRELQVSCLSAVLQFLVLVIMHLANQRKFRLINCNKFAEQSLDARLQLRNCNA